MTSHESILDFPYFDRATALVLMAAYFDASEAGNFFAIGGYIFRKSKLRPFEKQWKRILDKHDLEYFHMADCNSAKGQFDGKDCDDAARMAIKAITDHAAHGFMVSIKTEDFYDFMGADGIMWNPYSICVLAAAGLCANWAIENDPKAQIIYVFEAGDDHQNDADKVMKSIADDPQRKERFFYKDHAFLTKKGSRPTQAADILAWHVSKQCLREETQPGMRLRGDFRALLDSVPTKRFVLGREFLSGLVEGVNQEAPIKGAEKFAGLVMRMNKTNEKSIGRELLRLIREG